MLSRDFTFANLETRRGVELQLGEAQFLLDQLARLPVEPKQLPVGRLVHEAQLLLRRQGVPGWREGE